MGRIPQVEYATAPEEIRAAWDEVAKHHVISNMKAVALHSPAATHAILEWYALLDAVKPYLGERLAILYCHAISRENACKLCWTFMRKEIIDGGEDPEAVSLDQREADVVELGRQLVEIVTFGALMVVNNIFNSALQVDLDGVLDGYELSPEQAAART
jgi:hypothetical protein